MLLASFFRSSLRDASLTLAALAAATTLLAQTPSASDGFDPNLDGNLYAIAVQPDGKIVVGGQFTTFRNVGGVGVARNNLARFSSDGALEHAFDPNPNGPIRAIAMQPDGKIIIGGDFTSLQPNGAPTATTRNRIARLNSDGTLDATFDPNFGGALIPQVHALLIQPDGRLVVGGSFTTVQPNGAPAPITRNYMARLNSDGSLDAGYNPNPNAIVLALAMHVDGKVLVGGGFVRFQENGRTEATERKRIARLNPDGTVDSEFNPNADNGVTAIAVQRDGKILIGGFFSGLLPLNYPPRPVGFEGYEKLIVRFRTSFPNEDIGTPEGQNAFNVWSGLVLKQFGVSRWEELPVDFAERYNHGGAEPGPRVDLTPAARERFARLHADGSLDSDFVANAGGNVRSIGVQPDGSIVIGGAFTQLWGKGNTITSRSHLARFNPDGSLDLGFNPGINSSVEAIAFQTDGRIVIGGYFTHAQPPGATTAINRNRLARLNPDGSVDANFQIDTGGRILTEVVQADGKIIIGGSFTNVGGEAHNYLARLHPDGSVDSSYKPDFNGRVLSAVVQPDGKVIVAGSFTTIGGEAREHIARLNPDGTIDSEFNPSLDNQAGALALQSDGKILVAGSFIGIRAVGMTERVRRAYILRLNADGSLDDAFDPAPNNIVSVMVIQKDGKIVVGGDFLAFTPGGSKAVLAESFLRFSIARLNADGTVDKGYDPSLSGQVTAIVLQSDGKAVVGGVFGGLQPRDTTVTNPPRRLRIARFNEDGTLDMGYDPSADSPIMAMAIQSDDKVIIGGSFVSLQPNGASDWTLRKYAARLNTDGTVDSTFDLDLGERPGNRVDSLRIQPDGRVLIGGSFTSLQPLGSPNRVPRQYLARINADGTLDPGFEVKAGGATGGQIRAFAVQGDAKVIAAGSFSDLGGARSFNVARFNPEGSVDPTFSSALSTDGTVHAVAIRPHGALALAPLRGFAWLEPTGNMRTGFNPGPVSPIVGQIFAFARESGGSVIVGGSFTNALNPLSFNLARFSASGAMDLSFAPTANASITDIAVQADGKIIITGAFTSVNGVVRNRMARLNQDGTLDTSYDPNVNGRVAAVVLQSDGKALIAGSFTGLVPAGQAAAVSQPYIARVNPDGSLDRDYATIPNGPITSLTIQGDGKVIAGGQFTIVQSNANTFIQERNFIVRLNTDGTLDANFNPNVNGPVNVVAAQPNGQIVLGGSFTRLQPNGSATPVIRSNIARVNFDGTLDTDFDPNANGSVTTLSIQPDGSIVFGGVFTTIQPAGEMVPITRFSLARVTSSGAVDLGFNPDLNGDVNAVDALADGSLFIGGNFTGLQPIGSIVIGGAFGSVGGVPAQNLAILNDNGSVSASFLPKPDGAVHALLMQPDGRTVVGGAFANVAGSARNRIARFASNGSLDAVFNPNANGSVFTMALQADGKILLGGAFTTVAGQIRNGLARIHADGTLDGSFAPTATLAGLAVRGLAVQRDGRILVLHEGSGVRHLITRLNADGTSDGTFTAVSSGAAAFNSITLQTDGRIVVAGDFTTLAGAAVARVGRLNPDGSIDATFNPGPDGAVTTLALQADGRLMLGGNFTRVGGLVRISLARLAATGPAIQTLGVSPGRNAVLWNRSGTGGEISAAIFEQSSDRRNWVEIGHGTRVAGTSNWELSGLSLPASGTFYLRARGITPSSGGASSGFYELVREFNFANPAPTTEITTLEMKGGTGTAPAQAASTLIVDPFTGIASGRAITVVPGEGTVEIIAASQSDVSTVNGARLVNLSTRGQVTPGNSLVLGFSIAGTEQRTVLLRAVGPGLGAFNVDGALRGTRLELHQAGTGTLLASNQGWAADPVLTAAAAQTGAFPLDPASADSAVLATLAPGNYTIQAVDTQGGGGVALVEIYDAGTGSGSRLVNVSSLGQAGAGNHALISGFVIGGGGAERVLLRGVGPGLADHTTVPAVSDPSIMLYDAAGGALGGNDNWVSSVDTASTAAASSGAFSLIPGSKDAAVVATLPSGVYTVQVSAANGSTGAVLLEIYEVR